MVSNFTDRNDLGLWDHYSYQTLVLFGICTVVQCGAIVLNRRTGDQSYSSTELQCSVSLVNIHSAFACLTKNTDVDGTCVLRRTPLEAWCFLF